MAPHSSPEGVVAALIGATLALVTFFADHAAAIAAAFSVLANMISIYYHFKKKK